MLRQALQRQAFDRHGALQGGVETLPDHAHPPLADLAQELGDVEVHLWHCGPGYMWTMWIVGYYNPPMHYLHTMVRVANLDAALHFYRAW